MIDACTLHLFQSKDLTLINLVIFIEAPLPKFAIVVHAVVIIRKPSAPDLLVFTVTSPTPPADGESGMTRS